MIGPSQTLLNTQDILCAICNSALDAVVVVNAKGEVVHWNPAAEAMFGYSPEEILGQKVHDLLTPPRHRERAAEGMHHFRFTGEGPGIGKVVEMSALRKDGSEFPIDLALSPIRMENEWWASAVIRDITSRRQAEQKLRLAHEELESRTAQLAKTHEKLRREHEDLKKLLKMHDRERLLIAYQIHDRLAQQLAAATMQFQACELRKSPKPEGTMRSCDWGFNLVRESLEAARDLIDGVRPPVLDEFGIIVAIENLICERTSETGPKIEFHNEVQFDRLEPVLENALYCIIQEALFNACIHSRSNRVRISLVQRDGNVEVEVRDWGIGFEQMCLDGPARGLEGIRERARLFEGTSCITSSLGQGTTVTVQLPLTTET